MPCLPITYIENVEARETELRRARTLCYALGGILQDVSDRLTPLREIASTCAAIPEQLSDDAADRETLRRRAQSAVEKLEAMRTRITAALGTPEAILAQLSSELKTEALQFLNISLQIEIGRPFTLDDGRRILVNSIEIVEPWSDHPAALRIEGPYLRKDGKLGAAIQCQSLICQTPASGCRTFENK